MTAEHDDQIEVPLGDFSRLARERFAVSIAYAAAWAAVQDGRLPAYRLGKRWVVKADRETIARALGLPDAPTPSTSA